MEKMDIKEFVELIKGFGSFSTVSCQGVWCSEGCPLGRDNCDKLEVIVDSLNRMED